MFTVLRHISVMVNDVPGKLMLSKGHIKYFDCCDEPDQVLINFCVARFVNIIAKTHHQ